MKRIICIICLMLIGGCAIPKADTKPINHREKWKVLAAIIKSKIETNIPVENMAAELAYLDYLRMRSNGR